MNRRIVLVAIGIICTFVLMFAAYGIVSNRPSLVLSVGFAQEWAFSKIAYGIISDCAHVDYPPACYNREIPKLMDQRMSMEDAFAVTRAVVAQVPEYAYCHVVAHALGSKETTKDSEQWVSVSARCPTDMCAYGCFHGVVEARFSSETLPQTHLTDLLPTLFSVCREGKGGPYTRLSEHICQHGLGHLMMFATGGDIPQSLAACDALSELAKQTDAQTEVKKFCYEGAFMQVFQSLTAEEKALVRSFAPTTSAEAGTYCNGFPPEQAATCHRESWPLAVSTLDTARGISLFCETSSDLHFVQQCYNMVFHTTTSRFQYNEKRIIELCAGFPDNRKAQCFARTASTFVYTDARLHTRASALCKIADTYGVGARCYRELLYFSTYAYKKDSTEFNTFCKALPDEWMKKCMAGEGANLSPFVLDT